MTIFHRPSSFLATILFGVIVGLFAFTGCQSNRDLDPTGPYASDGFLWAMDGLILDIGNVIKEVEGLAARNPAVLAANPSLAESVAKIHRQRDGVIERNPDGSIASHETYAMLVAARDAYKDVRDQARAQELQERAKVARLFLEQARALIPLFFAQPST